MSLFVRLERLNCTKMNKPNTVQEVTSNKRQSKKWQNTDNNVQKYRQALEYISNFPNLILLNDEKQCLKFKSQAVQKSFMHAVHYPSRLQYNDRSIEYMNNWVSRNWSYLKQDLFTLQSKSMIIKHLYYLIFFYFLK